MYERNAPFKTGCRAGSVAVSFVQFAPNLWLKVQIARSRGASRQRGGMVSRVQTTDRSLLEAFGLEGARLS